MRRKNERDNTFLVILEIGRDLPYRETTDILIHKAARQNGREVKLSSYIDSNINMDSVLELYWVSVTAWERWEWMG